MAIGALGETFKGFDDLLRVSPGPENTLSLLDGRWLWNGSPAMETGQNPETLKTFFAECNIHSLTFQGDVRFYEFSALCELAASPAPSPDPMLFIEALEQKGVTHIRADSELYARAKREPPAASSQARPEPAPEPKLRTANFSQFLKQLVESSVENPEERTHIYADALSLVKQSLDRHVAEATATIEEEKRHILAEQLRTERVLSTIADGKVIVDQNGRVLMMNTAAEEISGKRLSEVAGRPVSETMSGHDRMLSVAKDIVVDPDKPLSQEVSVVADASAEQSMKRSLAIIQDESGRMVGTYAVMPHVQKFEEAKRQQEEFLQRVTHDLKAPLTSICSALELIEMKAGPKLSQEENHFLEVCSRNAKQLGEMIGQILDFSKIGSGKLAVSLSPVPPEELVREAVEGLTPWAQRRGLALEGRAAKGLGPVSSDRQQVVHILCNLISNAIKATGSEGRITVQAVPGGELRPGMAVFSVSDTGCGIAAEDQARVFERFVQVPTEGKRREGVGLGLAIVRELVTLHRGTVWVESVSGKGSTFSFTLPLAGEPR